MTIRFLLLFLALNLACQGQDIYDIETLPTSRTKQYSLGPYNNIVIFSAKRTGSSLAYNIFKFLFEDKSLLLSDHLEFNLKHKVLKTHEVKDLELVKKNENVLFVFTYRNPLDTSISHFRITLRKVNDQEFAKELMHTQGKYLLLYESMKKEGCKILSFKYEDFANNVDSLFTQIEQHFHISIDPKDKELMRKGYSKENINLCVKDLENFRSILPVSGIHGKHVALEKYSPPPSFLHWLNVYLEDVKPLFQKYGYFSVPCPE